MENGKKQKTKNRKQIYFEAKMEGRLYGESGTEGGTYSLHIRFLYKRGFNYLFVVLSTILSPYLVLFLCL